MLERADSNKLFGADFLSDAGGCLEVLILIRGHGEVIVREVKHLIGTLKTNLDRLASDGEMLLDRDIEGRLPVVDGAAMGSGIDQFD